MHFVRMSQLLVRLANLLHFFCVNAQDFPSDIQRCQSLKNTNQTPLHGFMGGVAVAGTLRERCKALIILSHFEAKSSSNHPMWLCCAGGAAINGPPMENRSGRALAGLWQGNFFARFLAPGAWRFVCCVVIEEDPENDWKGVDVLSRVSTFWLLDLLGFEILPIKKKPNLTLRKTWSGICQWENPTAVRASGGPLGGHVGGTPISVPFRLGGLHSW